MYLVLKNGSLQKQTAIDNASQEYDHQLIVETKIYLMKELISWF